MNYDFRIGLNKLLMTFFKKLLKTDKHQR